LDELIAQFTETFVLPDTYNAEMMAQIETGGIEPQYMFLSMLLFAVIPQTRIYKQGKKKVLEFLNKISASLGNSFTIQGTDDTHIEIDLRATIEELAQIPEDQITELYEIPDDQIRPQAVEGLAELLAETHHVPAPGDESLVEVVVDQGSRGAEQEDASPVS